MSHELRTPLNSMLILSRLLAENEAGALDQRQVEFAQTIHSAGNDLLSLINDILDLSKVEAGRMELDMGVVALSDIYEDAERAFRQVAEEKDLTFAVQIDPALPQAIVTDQQRLGQILKNLLANAFKFTHRGSVTLGIGYAPDDVRYSGESLQSADQVVALSVSDTGVGIPSEKLAAIFEAFQQADGTTSRKYGGTGLGLSISREIAWLLGGEIQVASTPGEGSRFTLFLPLTRPLTEVGGVERAAVATNGAGAPPADSAADEAVLSDDRSTLQPDDRVLLVVDSAEERGEELVGFAHLRGVKAVVARRPSAALALAREHRPEAILLAGELSRVDALLGQLKKHPDTRHLPVLLLSEAAARFPALRAGAAGFIEEPLDTARLGEALDTLQRLTRSQRRRVAVVQDGDGDLAEQIPALLAGGEELELEWFAAEDAIAGLRREPFDLTLIAVAGSGRASIELLRELATDEQLRERPVIAYAAGTLTKAERARLEALAKGAVITVADSPERLVERTAIYLHRVEAQLPGPTRKLLGQLRTGDAPLHGKKVLVIDDDIRNVFALTSALEQRGMKVAFAENGREGIERLHQHPNTDIVLLDIMMPEMDGYETARAIRGMPRYEHLPIISLTAKAMKGDREKAIAAGASDYITKPVDVDQLVSMMRVWLDA